MSGNDAYVKACLFAEQYADDNPMTMSDAIATSPHDWAVCVLTAYIEAQSESSAS
jgi:hypothetical protein